MNRGLMAVLFGAFITFASLAVRQTDIELQCNLYNDKTRAAINSVHEIEGDKRGLPFTYYYTSACRYVDIAMTHKYREIKYKFVLLDLLFWTVTCYLLGYLVRTGVKK